MNLITDEWIPIIRRSGKKEKIAPWQLAETDNPVWSLDTPRPDFDGALIQFLIGLFQTFMPPKGEEEWIEKLENPPSARDLKEALLNKEYLYAFDVKGEKGSFMEDFCLLKELTNKDKIQSIAQILIESPGESTIKQNTDHFIKRKTVEQVCPHCAVMALLTLQTNAPSGGSGHRTSLRGGGPLTTLVIMDENSDLPKSLWVNVWLNVLYEENFRTSNNNDLDQIFPWLTQTRTSNKGSPTEKTTPLDAHPLQAYWGVPRRIRIDWNSIKTGVCDLCHKDSDQLVSHYKTKPHGINYEGAWEHPLSPHQLKKIKEDENKLTIIPRHPQPEGFTYNHWPSLAVNDESNSKLAKVVSRYLACQWEDQLRIWAFGYDIDKMKARCWYEAKMPLFHIPQDKRAEFSTHINLLVKMASQCANKLTKCIKDAWKDPKDKGKNKKKNNKVDISFIKKNLLDQTEAQFYEIAKKLSEDVMLMEQEKAYWYQILEKESLKIFDFWVLKCDFTYSDLKRIVKARKQMKKELCKIKKELGLLPPKPSRKKSTKRRT